MRHRKAGVKLGRTGSHRNAMFRNMVTSLLKHGRIRTTDTKAKELRRWSDHIITLAKRGDLHARRQALSIVNEKAVVHRLFEKAEEQFGGRAGGYTRLTKADRRAGDAAPMTIVDLITGEVAAKSFKKGAPDKKPDAVPRPSAVDEVRREEQPVSTTSESVEAETDQRTEDTRAAAEESSEMTSGDVDTDDNSVDNKQVDPAAEIPLEDDSTPDADSKDADLKKE